MSRTYRNRKYTFQQYFGDYCRSEKYEVYIFQTLAKYYKDNTFVNTRKYPKPRIEGKTEIVVGIELYEVATPNFYIESNLYNGSKYVSHVKVVDCEPDYFLDEWKDDDYYAKDYGRYYKSKSKKFQSNMFEYTKDLQEHELIEW